jgi:hypothetical protein
MLHLTSLAVLITTLRVGIAANDPYFNTTVLLLNGDVTPFTDDASINKFSLNPFGAPRATTFNPYQEGYYSGLFNGTSTSVNPATIPIASTGAFTIEGWIYSTSSSLQCIYSQYASAGSDPGRMNLMFNDPAGKISIGTGAGANGTLISVSSIPLNIWTHFALVRDASNVAKIYINGVLDATNATFTTTILQTTAYIGYTAASPGYGFYGYISNFRITNTAVYTGNFTVSTVPLTATQSSSGNIAAITGTATSLLTLQSSWFKDNSTNTVTGSNTIISGYQPFILPSLYSGYGSGLFNGSSDYFTVTKTGGWLTSGGNFTVEYWAYLTSYPSSSSGNYIAVPFGTSGYSNGWEQGFGGTASSYTSYYFAFKGAGGVSATYSFLLNRWYHIAVVKNSSTTTAYINGVSSGTSTNITTWTDNAGMNIGLLGVASYPYWYPGYISNMRIVNGTAVYTGAFTPPTAPLSRIQSSGTNIAALTGTETVLLTLQNNQSQNNNQFRDSSSSNFTITRSGTPTQGTFTPFSQTGWSGYFDGSSYISVADSANLEFDSGDMTAECWFYMIGTGGYLLNKNYSGASPSVGFALALGTTAINWYLDAYNASVCIQVSIPVTQNTWHHIAIVRSVSGTTNNAIFLDGIRVATSAVATAFPNNNQSFNIGTTILNGAAYSSFTGYISNVRVVKGTAVYNPTLTTLTIPTTPLTSITNTVLLTLQNNYFKDNSANVFAIVMSGSPKIQSFSPFAPTAAYSAATVGGSAYFNGTGDYLTAPASAVYDFGSGAFTVECWIYQTASTGAEQIFMYHGWAGAGGLNYGWRAVILNSTNQLFFYSNGTGTTFTDLVVSPNVWTHVAFVGSGGVLSAYKNGVKSATTPTYTALVDRPSSILGIGGFNNADENIPGRLWFGGYLSNLRIVKGLAVYTSAFTPPTAPLPASITITTTTTNTIEYLVIAGGGAGGSASNNDTGGGGGAGGLLTGNITALSNTVYTISLGAGGTGAAAGTNGGNGQNSSIVGTGISLTSIGGGGGIYRNNSGSTGGSGGGAGSSGSAGGSGTAGPPRQGYNGGTASFNGTSGTAGGGGGAGAVGTSPGPGGVGVSSSISGSATYYAGGGGGATSGGTTQVGGTGGGGGGGRPALAAVVGAVNTGGGAGGVWAPNATPVAGINGGSGIVVIRYLATLPAALSTTNATMTLSGGYRIYTWTTSGAITFDTFPILTSTTVTAQSSLLLSGTNTGIQDTTGKNTLTTVGDVRVSTAVKKYGTGAMYFDGTGDYLTITSVPLWDFGTGNFTIEFWINTTQTTSNATLITRSWVSSPWTGGWGIQLNGNSSAAMTIYWADYSTSSPFMTANTTSYRDGNWHHIAWVRNGTSFVLYIDGVSVATATSSIVFGTVTKNIIIGEDLTFGPRPYLGYIDDLRITKYARYTANFVPPSAALPVL